MKLWNEYLGREVETPTGVVVGRAIGGILFRIPIAVMVFLALGKYLGWWT